MVRPAAAALLAALAFSAAALAGAADLKGSIRDTRADLSQLKGELRASERDARAQSNLERAEVLELERLDRELAASRRDAWARRRNLALVLDRMRAIAAASARLEDEEAADRGLLAADLVALYKAGAGTATPLWEASGPARLRRRYLEVLAAAASARMAALGTDLDRLAAYRQEFDSRYAALRDALTRGESARRRVERERAGAGRRLRRARAGEARARNRMRRLRASEDRLQGMLGELQARARRRLRAAAKAREAAAGSASAAEGDDGGMAGIGAGSGAATAADGGPPAAWTAPPPYRGRGLGRGLPWPVRGRVVSRFGRHLHPLYHVAVFNHGIQIAARYGTPVRAVAPGVVDYAGPMEGFGDLVILDHGRGMLSVYGYGSRLLVRQGQILARGRPVEDVGRSPDSGRPSLYFEIRRGALARDPLGYLARR